MNRVKVLYCCQCGEEAFATLGRLPLCRKCTEKQVLSIAITEGRFEEFECPCCGEQIYYDNETGEGIVEEDKAVDMLIDEAYADMTFVNREEEAYER